MCLSHTKGGQEKEDQSQQIPTFKCSEWSILKICIACGYVASTGPPRNSSLAIMAPMMHPRHQP